MQVEEIFISMGSNTGARELMLQEALKEIALLPVNIMALSGIYETASWGIPDQPPYLNQVIRISTSLEPSVFMQNLLQIEQKLGRIRSGERWLSRTIDLDILFFGNLILQTPALQLPHPRLSERRFVLVPLAEIRPFFRDPLTKKTVLELLRDCQDPLQVNLWPLSKSSVKG
jgi:2-amino-4-hydroxy-6-hydroxymethyldihydropteridine diphosphokinase